nr:MAG TPA: hypothetical protein [Caudoviricetes sp.]
MKKHIFLISELFNIIPVKFVLQFSLLKKKSHLTNRPFPVYL